jgi:protein phosphatase
MPDSPLPPGIVLGVDPAQAQHVGRRATQQDAFGFSTVSDEAFMAHGGQLAVLADGMGGLRHGLWSATQAVQAFIEAYQLKTADEPVADALQRARRAANAVVHGEAVRLDLVDRMGTTLAAAVVRGLELHWLNVGDSRVYLGEDGHLLCLSTDHRFAEVLLQRVHRGELSAGEALSHPLREALTSYLGRPEPLVQAASEAPVQLRPGAWVLLCSDGLTQALDDDAIRAQLHGPAQEACDRLLQAALARGLPDQDNVTAVVLHVPRPGQALDTGSSSRGVYGQAPGRLLPAAWTPASTPAPAASPVPDAAGPEARPRWREPLWWAGAVAAVGAVGLLLLARTAGPGSIPTPQAASRAGPSIDLLAAPPASGVGKSSKP